MLEKKLMAVRRPRLGVIIPYYNGESYWMDLVKALSNQARPLDHAVIVLDGMNQCLPNIDLKGIANEVTVVQHLRNLGVAEARNTGLDLIRSDYVFFLDQDDYWHSNRVSEFYSLICERRPGWLVSHYDMVDSEGIILRRVKIGSWVSSGDRRVRINRQYTAFSGTVAIAAVCCSKEIAPRFDSALESSDDYLFIFRLLDRAPAELVCASTGVRRYHSANTSLSKSHIMSRIRAVRSVRKKFEIAKRSGRRGLSNLCLRRAIEYLHLGEYPRARWYFRRALRLDLLNARAAIGLGACVFARNPIGVINAGKKVASTLRLTAPAKLVGAGAGSEKEKDRR
jgi:glycosyltransferase involved in cell wall biosynthesis